MDNRYMKSREWMKEALLVLMKTRELQDITIMDLVRKSGVNRGTFYNHFGSKEEVLNEILEEVLEDLIASYRKPYEGITHFRVEQLSKDAIKIFDHVLRYEKFYALVCHHTDLSNFQDRFCTVLKNLALTDLFTETDLSLIDPGLLAGFYAYAIYGMIAEWVQSDFFYSADYMAEQLFLIATMRVQTGE